jgi:hypothetical protein
MTEERLAHVHEEWDFLKRNKEQELVHEDWCEDPNCNHNRHP